MTQVHAGIHIRPPPVNRMTNRCKNITLPQTSFAGGNNNNLFIFIILTTLETNCQEFNGSILSRYFVYLFK